MPTLPLKASGRNSVLLFVFGGQKDLAQMQFSLVCVQCSCLRDQQHMFGVKSFLMVKTV